MAAAALLNVGSVTWYVPFSTWKTRYVRLTSRVADGMGDLVWKLKFPIRPCPLYAPSLLKALNTFWAVTGVVMVLMVSRSRRVPSHDVTAKPSTTAFG